MDGIGLAMQLLLGILPDHRKAAATANLYLQ